MSIESIGVYSPNTIYGQLTRPFQGEFEKPVAINSHTPFDENGEDETVLTKDSFYNNLSSMRVAIDEIREMKGIELDESIKTKIGPEVKTDFLSQNVIPAFQLSTFNTGTGVVYEALQNGYTANQAIVIGKAHNAYQNAATHNQQDIVQNLLSANFKVA